MARRVLVTGAGGFIGSHIAERLVASGCEVTGLVRRESQLATLTSRGIRGVRGDVTMPATLGPAMQDVEVVVHAAAKVTDWGSWTDFHQATVLGTRNTVEAAMAAHVRKFVHVSSVVVYDDRHTRRNRIVEETCPHGAYGDRLSGLYARSKVEAEVEVVRLTKDALPAVILRPAFVYGPRDRTIIPRLLEYLRGFAPAWIGTGNPTIDPVYVTDVAECAARAALTNAGDGQAFNLAPNREIGVREFITSLCATFDIPLPRWRIPHWAAVAAANLMESIARFLRSEDPPALTRAGVAAFAEDRYHLPRRALESYNWQARTSLADGVAFTRDWINSDST